MPRRLAAVLAVAFMMLCVVLPVTAQSRSVFWRQWNVRIDNIDTTNNQFSVTELYTVDFTGTFRFGTLMLPYTNLEDIRDIQVWQDRQPLEEGCSENPGTFCVFDTDADLSATYYFSQPITDGSAEFMIRYTVVGALRIYEGGDQLWWTAVPADHYGFLIGSSTVVVQLPSDYAPREGIDPIETYGTPAVINVNSTTLTMKSKGQLDGDDYLEIRVQYPHDPSARTASWQAAFDQQRDSETSIEPFTGFNLIALSVLLLIMHVITGR